MICVYTYIYIYIYTYSYTYSLFDGPSYMVHRPIERVIADLRAVVILDYHG